MTISESAPFRHKEDRRVKRTIGAIHEAFFKLAEDVGIEKITVAAVAEEADINRKTFYLHYASIEDLIDELLYDEVKECSKALGQVVINDKGEVDVRQLFTALGTELLQRFEERSSAFKNIDSDWMLDRLEPMFTKEITENDSLNLAHALGDSLEYCVTFFCAGLIAAYRLWMSTESEVSMEKLTGLLSAIVTGGIEGALEVAR